MKIGAQTYRSTAISASDAATIVVRGHDLCTALLGRITFTDHIWLLVVGALPSDAQRQVLDATLVAIAEHGLVPSVQASRMTLAAAPEALQGAVAAGILGCGSVILGAAQNAGQLLQRVVERTDAAGTHNETIDTILRDYTQARQAVPGYGHPLHKGHDPRATRLLSIATEVGASGRYAQAAYAIEQRLPVLTGKPLAMNVSGAIAAVLLDAGFPLLAIKGVPLLARTASLIAHLLEEQSRPIGFVLSHAAASAIDYDGPAPDGFVPTDR